MKINMFLKVITIMTPLLFGLILVVYYWVYPFQRCAWELEKSGVTMTDSNLKTSCLKPNTFSFGPIKW